MKAPSYWLLFIFLYIGHLVAIFHTRPEMVSDLPIQITGMLERIVVYFLSKDGIHQNIIS